MKSAVSLFLHVIWISSLSANVCERAEQDATLQKITFSGEVKKTRSTSTETGVFFENVNIPNCESFRFTMKRFLNRPLTMEMIEQIQSETVQYYRDQGFPLVGVLVPAGQDITDGSIHVVITVAKLETVKGEGARWFSNEKIARGITLQPGDDIRTAPLLSDISWLNNNPFRSVSLVYEKGAGAGETDIVAVTKDRFPLRVYSGYQNTGNIIAGDNRWMAGLTWGNAWGVDHQLNYQFLTANSARKWWGNVANYIAPLPWRHTLKIFGSYVLTEPNLSDFQAGSTPLEMNGKGWVIGGRYVMPLPTFVHYKHALLAGYDFKRTNNFLTFSETLIFSQFFDISQFLLGYEGTYENDWGFAVWGANAYLSPGKMTAFNTDRNFETERQGADANYIYGVATLDWIVRLPANFAWSCASKGQYSTGPLLPSEELSLGGFLTVRGYDENEIISDRGFLLKNELRSPVFPLFLHMKKFKDEMQLLLFLDYGYANGIDPNILNQNSTHLASWGPGFYYRIQDYASVRFDYGFQLKTIHDRPFTDDDHSRMHLEAFVSF